LVDGLRDFLPSADLSPGRMNVFRLGRRTIIVDFAHNEAGTEAILDVAEGLARGAPGSAAGDPTGGAAGGLAPITAIIGTAGDRPDDTLRGIGRLAAERAGRVAIKETLGYLRGREREGVVQMLRDGIAEGGMDASAVPVYETEAGALAAELTGSGAAATGDAPDAPRVIVLFCHEAREEVFALLEHLGARPLDAPAGPRDVGRGG
ncbi:MAG: hypothetical protein MUQ32_10915, partial [Chloroflexi bacterium]|nr:hypothetical protein [Chloroflexota bacterium]